MRLSKNKSYCVRGKVRINYRVVLSSSLLTFLVVSESFLDIQRKHFKGKGCFSQAGEVGLRWLERDFFGCASAAQDCVKMCSLYALEKMGDVVLLWSQLLNNTSFIVANSSQDHTQ